MREIKRFACGDTLVMKKPHPCGSVHLKVMRVGSDIRVVCEGCGHDMTLPRVKLEKNIRSIICGSGQSQTEKENDTNE